MSNTTFKNLEEMLKQEERLGPVADRPLVFDPSSDNLELIDTLRARHELNDLEGSVSVASLLEGNELDEAARRRGEILHMFQDPTFEILQRFRREADLISRHQRWLGRKKKTKKWQKPGPHRGLMGLVYIADGRGIRPADLWNFLEKNTSAHFPRLFLFTSAPPYVAQTEAQEPLSFEYEVFFDGGIYIFHGSSNESSVFTLRNLRKYFTTVRSLKQQSLASVNR